MANRPAIRALIGDSDQAHGAWPRTSVKHLEVRQLAGFVCLRGSYMLLQSVAAPSVQYK